MTDLLRAEGLSAFYGASQILFKVDLALEEKRTLALLGRNGAGKSTTMKTLAGIVPAKGGRIFFAVLNGEPVGCCGLAATGPGEFEVAKMAVQPARQGLD